MSKRKTTTTEQARDDHAEQNADAWAEGICEEYRAACALRDGAQEVKIDGDTYTTEDDITQRVNEGALCVLVRDDWRVPGSDPLHHAAEFNIDITTGGPAMRVRGDLDTAQPEKPRVEICDWGRPWTEYRPAVGRNKPAEYEAALAWWLGCFYFGD